MKDLLHQTAQLMADAAGVDVAEIEPHLIPPPKPEMGDISLPCFPLAKKLRTAPPLVAKTIANAMAPSPDIERAEAVGPYVNVAFDRARFADRILTSIFALKADYGSDTEGTGKTIVIDFSHPNIAKPFGIGHLRSTVIGRAIGSLYRALGYEVVGVNHLGDWGTQFGKLIVGFEKWGSEEELQREPIRHLYEVYVKYHQEAEKDESLDVAARAVFREMEEGDEARLAVWRRFVELSLAEFGRIYDLLEVTFESYAGESFYNEKMDATVQRLAEKGLLAKSEGAEIVDLEPYGLTPCLIRKSDGATLYATRDVCAAEYRKDTYNFHKLLYVVGAPQKLHFLQVFKVLELMGYDWAKDCVHVDFGLMRFADGTMSTRRGQTIFLEDVLTRAIDLARETIEEKNPELPNKEEIARQVGIGAIIFADLRNRRVNDIIFDWSVILDFEGETGPYLQYTHARACSILRKYGSEVRGDVDFSLLSADEEHHVITALAQFPSVVKRAAVEYEPSLVSSHLLELGAMFNGFYHKYKVVDPDNEPLQRARILLVDTVREVMARGLGLLGIHAPIQM